MFLKLLKSSMIDFVLNVTTNKSNVCYLIMRTNRQKKKKRFKLLSLKIMISTKVVNTHTRCYFYIIRETKYFNIDRY